MEMKVLKVETRPRSRRLPDAQRFAKSRAYVFPKGETLIENLMNRRSRPYHAYRKAMKDEGMNMSGARWSRTAGCGCGCSPGFIFPNAVRDGDTGEPLDYFVTVVDADYTEEATYLDLVEA